jgi:hypothetical protein
MWAEHVAHMGEMRNAYILIIKPKERRQLGRPRLDGII